jgi:hypothetical protein
MCDHCDTHGPTPVRLTFDAHAYRQASVLATAFAYGDSDAVAEILEAAGPDLAAAQMIMIHSALHRFSELLDTPFAEQIQDLGYAAILAAAEEGAA